MTSQTLNQYVNPRYGKPRSKIWQKSTPVRYWGIIAIIDGRKIKVILRKIGDYGTLHFWSVGLSK